MIQYLDYKGKKLPFAITMSTLVEFKKATGIDFELSLSGDIDKVYANMLTITILGLRKGFELENTPFYKVLRNLITTGTKIGIKNKDYTKIVDLEYTHISKIFPTFFTALSEEDKKK